MIEGAIECTAIKVPLYVKDYIRVFTTCDLSKKVVEVFNIALMSVSEQLRKENKTDLANVNCIITEYGEFTFQMDRDALGHQVAFCVYGIKKWENIKCNDNKDMKFILELSIVIEELCHHFWRIYDERLICYKVLEVMKIYMPDIEMEHIYNI